MKILKFSCVSGLNSGDDLISYVMERRFEKRHLICSLDILGQEFDLDKRLKSKATHRLPALSKPRNLLAAFIRWVAYKVLHRNRIKRSIKDNDFVIIGGGQIIDDFATGHMFYRIVDIVNICKKLNVPVSVCFVGVSELSPGNFRKLRNMATYLQEFSVRDSESLLKMERNSIQGNSINVIPDPVFTISDWIYLSNVRVEYVGINIMNLNRIMMIEDQDLRVCAKNLKVFSQHLGLKIRLILTSYGDDLDMARELKVQLQGIGVPVDTKLVTTAESVSEAYSGVEIMLSHRMHSSIIAMSFGIPCMIFNWHTKIKGLVQLVERESSLVSMHQDVNFDSETLLKESVLMIERKKQETIELTTIKAEVNNYFDILTNS